MLCHIPRTGNSRNHRFGIIGAYRLYRQKQASGHVIRVFIAIIIFCGGLLWICLFAAIFSMGPFSAPQELHKMDIFGVQSKTAPQSVRTHFSPCISMTYILLRFGVTLFHLSSAFFHPEVVKESLSIFYHYLLLPSIMRCSSQHGGVRAY